jgi:hypothetical protein
VPQICQTDQVLTPIYKNNWKINESNYVSAATAMYGMKAEDERIKRIKSARNSSCCSGADESGSQTSLDDRIYRHYRLLPVHYNAKKTSLMNPI